MSKATHDGLILSRLADGRLNVDPTNGVARWNGRAAHRMDRGGRYLTVYLGGPGLYGLVHRAIWIAARGPIPDGWEVDHLNGDKLDNRLVNLEAVDRGVNVRRARNGFNSARATMADLAIVDADVIAQALALAATSPSRDEIAEFRRRVAV